MARLTRHQLTTHLRTDLYLASRSLVRVTEDLTDCTAITTREFESVVSTVEALEARLATVRELAERAHSPNLVDIGIVATPRGV